MYTFFVIIYSCINVVFISGFIILELCFVCEISMLSYLVQVF
jgi:hypothetical protein